MRDLYGRRGYATKDASWVITHLNPFLITPMTTQFHGPMVFGAITCSLLGLVGWFHVQLTEVEPPTLDSKDVFVFQGLTGPTEKTVVAPSSLSSPHAYAIGIDLGALLLKGYNNRTDGFTISFDNRFDPTLDVWLRLLKRMYQTGEPNAVTIGTVPFGKSRSVMFTHDVDFTQSMANAVAYAEFERSKGLTGTYFIQAKYIRDYNGDIFFDEQGVRHLAR